MPIFETTLAQGTGSTVSLVQVLVYALFGVIFVSTMVKNIIKENKKKARRKQASGEAQPGGGASLDEIAARRRAQLQEMARQRGGGKVGGHSGGSSGGRPEALVGDDTANLSMAERIARARAANQRQTPRSGLAQASQAPPARPSVAPQVAGASAREQRAAAMRQRAMQREQQRREALAARQRQTQQARTPQRPAPPAQPARRPLPPVQTPHPVSVQPHAEVHRMVADAQPEVSKKSSRRHHSASIEAERAIQVDRGGAGASKTLLNFGKLSQADLRRAFILKEVLDRPLAERDALAHVNEG